MRLPEGIFPSQAKEWRRDAFISQSDAELSELTVHAVRLLISSDTRHCELHDRISDSLSTVRLSWRDASPW